MSLEVSFLQYVKKDVFNEGGYMKEPTQCVIFTGFILYVFWKMFH